MAGLFSLEESILGLSCVNRLGGVCDGCRVDMLGKGDRGDVESGYSGWSCLLLCDDGDLRSLALTCQRVD